MHFDSDSYDILVDNCCSRSITNDLKDYIKPPKISDKRVGDSMDKQPKQEWEQYAGDYLMIKEGYIN